MKVGDYVRTKNGKIFKWEENMTTEKFANEVGYDGRYIYINKDEIKKSSPNIIDLIEVGDYVDGIYIDTIEKEQKRVWSTSLYGDEDIVFYNDEIKSIVTKEQFESMEYKVGE